MKMFRILLLYASAAIILSSFITPKTENSYLIIEKSKRILRVRNGDKTIAQFNIVLGFAPIGDKMQEGDGKTPEGEFRVKAKYPHKSWRKFIWFDYPNADSYLKFRDRKRSKFIDETSSIGGDIGIHGVPKGMDQLIDQKNDWTLGCISLKNKDIDSLYNLISIGTIIYIKP